MEFSVIGRETNGVSLDLDHRRFAYAGKFVMSNTGKSVARDVNEIVGAVAFSEDHSDEQAVRLRYVTVRKDRRNEGIGSRLLRFTAERLTAEYDRIGIAVNNPIAYYVCYRAGFVFTGRETGIAELLLQYEPTGNRDTNRYQKGLTVFQDRELPEEQQSLLDSQTGTEPPPLASSPS